MGPGSPRPAATRPPWPPAAPPPRCPGPLLPHHPAALAPCCPITLPPAPTTPHHSSGSTHLSVDVVAVAQAAKLLLPRRVPAVEPNLAAVGGEVQRVHLHADGGCRGGQQQEETAGQVRAGRQAGSGACAAGERHSNPVADSGHASAAAAGSGNASCSRHEAARGAAALQRAAQAASSTRARSRGPLTLVLLLKLARQVALHKRGLACTGGAAAWAAVAAAVAGDALERPGWLQLALPTGCEQAEAQQALLHQRRAGLGMATGMATCCRRGGSGQVGLAPPPARPGVPAPPELHTCAAIAHQHQLEGRDRLIHGLARQRLRGRGAGAGRLLETGRAIRASGMGARLHPAGCRPVQQLLHASSGGSPVLPASVQAARRAPNSKGEAAAAAAGGGGWGRRRSAGPQAASPASPPAPKPQIKLPQGVAGGGRAPAAGPTLERAITGRRPRCCRCWRHAEARPGRERRAPGLQSPPPSCPALPEGWRRLAAPGGAPGRAGRPGGPAWHCTGPWRSPYLLQPLHSLPMSCLRLPPPQAPSGACP